MPTRFFNNEMGEGPWFSTSAEDMSLVTSSAEDFVGRNDWNEWMQWNPSPAQQTDSTPPLNAQGPVCIMKNGQKPPIYNRRTNTDLQGPTLGLQSNSGPTSQSPSERVSNPPYTFGENVENTPAFNFTSGQLSSSSVEDATQQNGFYSPPVGWDQQQSSENSIFSPVRFDQSAMANVPMPPLSTPSLQHSPNSLNNGKTSSSSTHSSPEPSLPAKSKKRKSSTEDDKPVEGKKEKQPPIKKTAHNMIEKRYRNNLNDKIAALRDSVPSLRVMSRPNGNGEEEDDPEDLEGLTPAHKLNKATVLSKATEYIRHLEKRNKRLTDEVTQLKGRLDSYEKMAISGPIAMTGHTPDGSRYQEDPFASGSMVNAVSGPPQGMIPVPESLASLHRGMQTQQHYAPQNNGYPAYTNAPNRPGLPGPPMVNGRRPNGMLGKLMVGSLAGLMILEGLVEREQSREEPDGRGLLALPLNLARFLTPQVSMGGATAQFPLAKFLLIFGAVFYIIAPFLDFRSKPKKKAAPIITLTPAPSLASPVEVRRKAWLTAIQTVWVPRHNFILEAAALVLKTLKLSLRKIIGWDGYAVLTGITKEQEAARVKAWSIALDAQLTGGDEEINVSRLLLTLMASGTLPDTPARLMLKSLHIRVLLWEATKMGYGTWYMVEEVIAFFARYLARYYWNMARNEHKVAANQTSKSKSNTELLPDYLVAVLDMDCDDVLVESIIQRAYNLAWNRDSSENTTCDTSMESVVEDFAISSPLDALAAWWSSYTLNKALTEYLRTKGALNDAIKENLDLAVRTAPPTSQAQLRAFVAKAIIQDEDRNSLIATAYKALPSPLSQDSKSQPAIMNLVSNAPIAKDVRTALTLAKCQALAESSNQQARNRAIFVVNNIYLPEAEITLLNFVAAYKVLNYFMQDQALLADTSYGLEMFARLLRMWMGHETARRSGLRKKIREIIIEQCLDTSKILVGLAQVDDGYVSQSESD